MDSAPSRERSGSTTSVQRNKPRPLILSRSNSYASTGTPPATGISDPASTATFASSAASESEPSAGHSADLPVFLSPAIMQDSQGAERKLHPVCNQSVSAGLVSSFNNTPLKSPSCFVHSHLDKIRKDAQDSSGLAGSPGGINPGLALMEEDVGESITTQLAATATTVREMSKELGRATLKPNIQSIFILTKARDNNLIKLTRELAIWLMTTPRPGKQHGLIVYVDSQLQKSKRFDAAGILREYPQIKKPLPESSRRPSRASSQTSSFADLRKLTAMNSEKNLLFSKQSSLPSKFSQKSLSNSTNSSSDDGVDTQEGQLRYWTPEMCSRSPNWFDLVVTLGGDGTVLYASWLFQHVVPPVLPFSLGSLGFLTNFDFADYPSVMAAAINNGVRVNLRMRFTVTVYRAVEPKDDKLKRKAIRSGKTGEIFMRDLSMGGWEALEGGAPGSMSRRNSAIEMNKGDKEVRCFITRPTESFEVLNDLVVDRGPSPYVSQLELFGDDVHVTTVQADGLIISTPTGSTAYSLSAGGSLVHPEIPAFLISPICPHTLSFRPILMPDSMELRICVPYDSRSTAWASFDGRARIELRQGDHIKITASAYPFPTVCADRSSTDWFHSIARTLKWNERQRQKSFVVVEEDRRTAHRSDGHQSEEVPSTSPRPVNGNHQPTARFASNPVSGVDESREEGTESDEEEEGFDIDDTSSSNEDGLLSGSGSEVLRPLSPMPSGIQRFGGAEPQARRPSPMRSESSPASVHHEKEQPDYRFPNVSGTLPNHPATSPLLHNHLQERIRKLSISQGGSDATPTPGREWTVTKEGEQKGEPKTFAFFGKDGSDGGYNSASESENESDTASQ